LHLCGSRRVSRSNRSLFGVKVEQVLLDEALLAWAEIRSGAGIAPHGTGNLDHVRSAFHYHNGRCCRSGGATIDYRTSLSRLKLQPGSMDAALTGGTYSRLRPAALFPALRVTPSRARVRARRRRQLSRAYEAGSTFQRSAIATAPANAPCAACCLGGCRTPGLDPTPGDREYPRRPAGAARSAKHQIDRQRHQRPCCPGMASRGRQE
jgi:hypothetical protein